jgi:hypothetical protein
MRKERERGMLPADLMLHEFILDMKNIHGYSEKILINTSLFASTYGTVSPVIILYIILTY